ncbi:hypothetical protein K8942_00685 [Candidatus Peribacteria bacterium]|nr:MAG: hypothetical protein K8942_00685 [Candidatus Peribacteria bacterium]
MQSVAAAPTVFALRMQGKIAILTIQLRTLVSGRTAGKMDEFLSSCFMEDNVTRFIVDFTEVQQVNQECFAPFCRLKTHLDQVSTGKMVLCAISPDILETFTSHGLHTQFTIKETVEKALADF